MHREEALKLLDLIIDQNENFYFTENFFEKEIRKLNFTHLDYKASISNLL